MLVWYMNRTDLQILAEDRLKDAEVLLAKGRFAAAYYLAGYAVECGLKACIAKLTKAEDFRINALSMEFCNV
jgi:HEPN domain-containing protein